MTTTVFVDAAGGTVGGAGRFRVELYQYLARTGREDVRVIGAFRRIDPAWLVRRELVKPTHRRRVALNNLSFLTPGSERWTRLGNPLDFLTDKEWDELHPSLKAGDTSEGSHRSHGSTPIGCDRDALRRHGRTRSSHTPKPTEPNNPAL